MYKIFDTANLPSVGVILGLGGGGGGEKTPAQLPNKYCICFGLLKTKRFASCVNGFNYSGKKARESGLVLVYVMIVRDTCQLFALCMFQRKLNRHYKCCLFI